MLMLMGKPRRNAFGRVGTKFWRQNFCCRHVGVNDLPRGGKKNSADTLYSAKGRVVRRRRLKKWRKKISGDVTTVIASRVATVFMLRLRKRSRGTQRRCIRPEKLYKIEIFY
jgi:hypothetical protein